MTKWQESCITALASSPYTWEVFKMKQRNKNLLWQYINRIWPYHRIEATKIRRTIENGSLKNCLISLLKILEEDKERILNGYGTSFEKMQFQIKLVDMNVINKAKSHPKRIVPETSINHFLQGNNIDVYQEDDLIQCLQRLEIEETASFTNICSGLNYPLQQYANCINSIQILLEIYDTYEKNIKKSKKIPKTAINWLNIGIEIEHDAENPTNPKIIKKILQQNCISYDSGFDGNSRDRLRENRIRLNGIKGLKGLYTLLQDMQENAAIATKSSVHIHIDCKYDESFDKIINKIRKIPGNNIQIFTKIISPVFKEFKTIFKIDEMITKNQFIRESDVPIRFSEEFYTTEYRFCIPNFNYSDYVIQILFLIHITECLKHGTKINKNYIKLMTKVITDLRN